MWPVNMVVVNRVVLGEGLIKRACKQGGPW